MFVSSLVLASFAINSHSFCILKSYFSMVTLMIDFCLVFFSSFLVLFFTRVFGIESAPIKLKTIKCNRAHISHPNHKQRRFPICIKYYKYTHTHIRIGSIANAHLRYLCFYMQQFYIIKNVKQSHKNDFYALTFYCFFSGLWRNSGVCVPLNILLSLCSVRRTHSHIQIPCKL